MDFYMMTTLLMNYSRAQKKTLICRVPFESEVLSWMMEIEQKAVSTVAMCDYN